ncbi:MAG: Xaa-Pro aminopeptidase, partial [Candidatus Omnitrophica bacterium CG11_big_fil_rev_8_21_14_0_20_45_26]
IIMASDLELDRAKKESAADTVLSTSEIIRQLKKKGASNITQVSIAAFVLKSKGMTKVLVPYHFPFIYAEELIEKGIAVHAKSDPFYESRTIKTKEEIKAITETLRHTERAIEAAVQVLKHSKIKGKYLDFEGKRLTSEDIKRVINVKLMENNCIASHTIVSCFNDCVDPHNQGSGPLLANQSIIMDVFPHSSETLYFADITRTFVRGKASSKIKKMYQTVHEGQKIAFAQIRQNADGSKIHRDIQMFFEKNGFKTGVMNGRMQGFFHGTGHGVGIEIHEPPRISISKDMLQTNQVVTVEPGLYYQDIGGVRLEDMVVVGEKSCTNLTKFPLYLEV